MENIGQIRAKNSEWAGESYMLLDDDLTCGQCLQVLVCNGLHGDTPEWIETRYEMDGQGHGYLVGLLGYQVSGLFAKRV